MPTFRRLACALLVAFALIDAVLAEDRTESIGLVKTVQGPAWVLGGTAGASAAPAAPGTPLYVGSVLRTGPNGAIGASLKDNTLLSLGAESELALDDYRFQPARGALGLVARIKRGTLEFVSGTIARLRPEAVEVKTPTGTLGVRGTRFLVKVEE